MTLTRFQPHQGFDSSMDTILLSFDASDFQNKEAFIAHIRSQIKAGSHSTAITYFNLPTDKFEIIFASIEGVLERVASRITFNSSTQKLKICIMPTAIHECHYAWMKDIFVEWVAQRNITVAESKHLHVFGSETQRFRQAPYAGSVKEPDLLVRPDNLPKPTMVIESGWTEPHRELMDDMNLWLVGGNGDINAVIIIDWQNTARGVQGLVELYVRDRQGMPIRAQKEQIFPAPAQQAATQAIHLTRRQLFGPTVCPRTNAGQVLDLRLDLLRDVARVQIGQMGLVPA